MFQQSNSNGPSIAAMVEYMKTMIMWIVILFVFGGLFYMACVLPAKAITWSCLPEDKRRHWLWIFLPQNGFFIFSFFNYGFTVILFIVLTTCWDYEPQADYTTTHIMFFIWWIIGPVVSLMVGAGECCALYNSLGNSIPVCKPEAEPVEDFQPRAPQITRFDLTAPRRIFRDGDLN